MTTLLAVFAAIAVFAYIAYLHNQINDKDNLITQWVSYADQIEASYSELSDQTDVLLSELNTIQKNYGLAITNYKIKMGVQPVAKIAYTGKTKNGDPVTRVVNQLGLFDQSAMFASGEYEPKFDTLGLVEYAPKVSTNGNGHKVETATKITESEAVDIISNLGESLIKRLGKDELSESESNRAVELVTKWVSEGKSKTQFAQWLADDLKSSNGDNGTFTPVTNDDSTLLKSDKYGKYLELLLADQNTKKLATAKYEYAKAMFLKWEKGNKPNTATEYAQRIINNKFGGK